MSLLANFLFAGGLIAFAVALDRSNRRLHDTKFTLNQRDLELAATTADLRGLRLELEAARKRPKTVDCDEMLRDLVSGGALLHVRRIDPNDVFMTSPRTSV